MKKFVSFILVLYIVVVSTLSAKNKAIFVSPVNESKFNNEKCTILIRFEDRISPALLNKINLLTVQGTVSGKHSGVLKLLQDNMLLSFTTNEAYALGEKVTVSLSSVLNTDVEQFSFFIRKRVVEEVFDSFKNEFDGIREWLTGEIIPLADSLPPDFPRITITVNSNPSPGRFFLSNFKMVGSYAPYLIILNNDGNPFFYRKMVNNCYDFKVQPNGKLTYADYNKHKFYMLDTNYVLIDSFACVNGYTTDEHDLQILPNGHIFLMSYDPQIVDMSQIVPGGDTAATVIGLVLQELDADRNLVFQWRSWDHFEITDATHEDLTAKQIDYVHGNAIEIDNDGNIVISSRHLDEITKIHRISGNIIWRWGGKNNQFVFTNDTIGFSHQHAIRRIANGNFTLFDNGNYHTPKFSRAIEYAVNEQAKTATLVWEYRHLPSSIYSSAMGNTQRLANGNTIVSWGVNNSSAVVLTEVKPDNTKVYEFTFPVALYNYRGFKFDWKPGTVTSLTENKIPLKFSLKQNYPNPFNPVTTIEFDIPVKTFVKLKVFDILGREVQILVDKEMEANSYKVEWNASNLSSGIYLYVLEAGEFRQVRTMALIK
ncbi:MAG: aryl-sulfate sulfotransferase [Ignavibacteria bacterium]